MTSSSRNRERSESKFDRFGNPDSVKSHNALGARARPDLIDKIDSIERHLQHTMFTHNGKPISIVEHIKRDVDATPRRGAMKAA